MQHGQTFEITASVPNSRVYMGTCATMSDRDAIFGRFISASNLVARIRYRITLAVVNKASARTKENAINKGDLISTCDSMGYECLSKIISLCPVIDRAD